MFINRKEELNQLEGLYKSGHAELFVLYGRRRVGKTELLRAFCEGKPHIFFIATLSTDNEQLANFSQQIYAFNHAEASEGFTFPSWEAAFRALADLTTNSTGSPARRGRLVVVLDEFTYLITGNKAIPSVIQKVWDALLKNTYIVLVLCGSYIGMMETEVLDYRAPLYGRRTASTLLQPLDLPSSSLFFSNYTREEQFLTWAVLGGMPYYLRTFSDQHTIYDNIRTHILQARTGTLFNEPRLLLMEELREPRNYFSILRAIAQGRTRLNEIALASGVAEVTSVARYLDILQSMRLVTRYVPVTESQPDKSKKGLYRIDDHFLRFWFRYVQPHQASLDLGLGDAILEKRIKPNLDDFVSAGFEEAACAFIAHMAQNGQLSFLPERIGGWWDRAAEIDVVAYSEVDKSVLVGECKWSVNPVGINVLAHLKEQAQVMLRGSTVQKVEYALFSRSGFTPAMQRLASLDNVRLFTVQQLVSGK